MNGVIRDFGTILGIGLAARFIEILLKLVFTRFYIPGVSEVATF